MGKYIYTFILFGFSLLAFAQQDTTAYSAQRVKVNALLVERSTKFSQYDTSLTKRSGIFGWQTKRDIKNSSEILRDIVLTDNNIFKELKILMDYKDLQNQQKVAAADQSEGRISTYMQTIKQLQDQNETLQKKINQQNKTLSPAAYALMALFIVMLIGFYLFNKKVNHYKQLAQKLQQ